MDWNEYVNRDNVNSLLTIAHCLKNGAQSGDYSKLLSLELPEVRDQRLLIDAKIKELVRLKNMACQPRFTISQQNAKHLLYKKYASERLADQMLDREDEDQATEMDYKRQLEIINSIPATVTEGKISKGYNPRTGLYTEVLTYQHEVKLEDFAPTCEVKGLISHTLDIYKSVKRTLKLCTTHGLTLKMVAKLLMLMLESTLPKYCQTLDTNEDIDPDAIFQDIIGLITTEHDQTRVKQAMKRVQRRVGQSLFATMSVISKLHTELLSMKHPFDSPASIAKKNAQKCKEFALEFVEDNLKEQCKAIMEYWQSKGKSYELDDLIKFIRDMETQSKYKLKGTKSMGETKVEYQSYNTSLQQLTNEMPAPILRNAERGRDTFRGKGRGRGGKTQKQSFVNTGSPRTRGTKSRGRGRGQSRGGYRPRSGSRPRDSSLTDKNRSAKASDKTKKDKTTNMNKAKNTSDDSNNNKKCYTCGRDSCRGGTSGKCSVFPNVVVTSSLCCVCLSGHHTPGPHCVEAYKRQQKN